MRWWCRRGGFAAVVNAGVVVVNECRRCCFGWPRVLRVSFSRHIAVSSLLGVSCGVVVDCGGGTAHHSQCLANANLDQSVTHSKENARERMPMQDMLGQTHLCTSQDEEIKKKGMWRFVGSGGLSAAK